MPYSPRFSKQASADVGARLARAAGKSDHVHLPQQETQVGELSCGDCRHRCRWQVVRARCPFSAASSRSRKSKPMPEIAAKGLVFVRRSMISWGVPSPCTDRYVTTNPSISQPAENPEVPSMRLSPLNRRDGRTAAQVELHRVQVFGRLSQDLRDPPIHVTVSRAVAHPTADIVLLGPLVGNGIDLGVFRPALGEEDVEKPDHRRIRAALAGSPARR